jgi:hypothetical protein
MKELIKKTPIIRSLAKFFYFTFIVKFKKFPGSNDYWKQRYQAGGTSGAGSYGRLARFKADIVNGLVRDEQISTIIEYGCGDGNQLSLSSYPSYIGFDISQEAISQCMIRFTFDGSKSFKVLDEYISETAQLTLSLDVIYHLIEDEVFNTYMERLFDTSEKLVIIYSSNTEKQQIIQAPHVKHRNFTNWIEKNRPDWRLKKFIPNKYPYSNDELVESFADFYIYEIPL